MLRPTRHVLSLTVALLLGTVTGADASSGVLPATQPIGNPPADLAWNTGVALATAGDGTTVAAFADAGQGPSRIQVAARTPGAAEFGAPTTVAVLPDGHTPFPPLVGTDVAGNVTVAWDEQWHSDEAGYQDAFWVATRTAGSATFGAPVQVTPDADHAQGAQLAVAPDGTTTLVWATNDPSTSIDGIRVATRPPGASFGAPVELSTGETGSDRLGSIAVGDDGTLAVTWEHQQFSVNGGTGDLSSWVARRAPGATTFDALTPLVRSTENGDQVGPAFPTIAPNGTVSVAYDQSDVSGYDGATIVRTAVAGAGFGGPIFPYAGPGRDRSRSIDAIQADHDGNVTVAWVTSADDGAETVRVATSPAGAVFLPYPTESFAVPVGGTVQDLVADADGIGGVHLVWTELRWSSQGSYATTVRHVYRPPGVITTLPYPGPVPATPVFPATRPTAEFAPSVPSAASVSLSADPFGDAAIAWNRSSAVIDRGGPTAGAIQGPTALTYGDTGTFSAAGSDLYSAPVSVHWAFGDGGTADGPTASHTFTTQVPSYGRSPAYLVTATLTDAAGNVTTRTLRVAILAPPRNFTPKKQAPVITPTIALALSRSRFGVVTAAKSSLDHGAVTAKGGGARLTVTTSVAGESSFQLARVVAGHRVGTRCATGAPTKRHAKACKALSTFKADTSPALSAGKNILRVTGRWGGKRLQPGVYRLSGYLISGPVSKVARVTFRITR